MSLRLKIFINKSKVVDNTYNLAGGQNLYITTLSNVPEGSTYRIRFIVKDSLSGQKSKGGFKKVVDCIETLLPTTTIGPVSTTTTTGPTPTTTIGPVSTTTTIGPADPDLTDPDKCLVTVIRSFNIQNLLDCIDDNNPDQTDPKRKDPEP